MKKFTMILLLLSTMSFAVKLSHPAWTANSVRSAMTELFGASDAALDSRITLLAPNVAANGGAIPVYISTTIDTKRIALFQDANPMALVSVWKIHKKTIPTFEIKIKMKTSGLLTVVVEAKDGKLYKAVTRVEVALGGCDGGGGGSYSSNIPSSTRMMETSVRRTKHASFKRIPQGIRPQTSNQNEYKFTKDNSFKEVASSALSTFSIDVDTASYTQIRASLEKRELLPPKEMVRIEEMINYFDYDYAQPRNNDPFKINVAVGNSLWNKESKILHIGLQTKKIDMKKLPASNFVFLLDVSGSMFRANKLPLLINSLKLLVKELRSEDKVSIVVYAGSSGLVLDRAKGSEKAKIYDALDRLRAGGSTAGGAGIKLAYDVALKAFIKGGNNRVILATDGDFNVGVSSENALIKLIESKRKTGVYLSVLGFGNGNFKDNKMEALADKGNGNYNYIDTLLEAKKVLVTQLGGTLYTVAKDVKIQVEFNPAKVHSYRLIGYENRLMANEDFNNDTKDAGEIGMGHTVTALYEVILNKKGLLSSVDKLKYQKASYSTSSELATIKVRYKKPDGHTSILLSKSVSPESYEVSDKDFIFSQDVAAFGMILRESPFLKNMNYNTLIDSAKDSKGKDREGYRSEFIKLVEKAQLIK